MERIAGVEVQIIDDTEIYERIATREAYEEYIKLSPWSKEEFERDLGVTFEIIKGRWFTIVNDRLFFL